MIGQLVTARAALELLRDRSARAPAAWPEFAEYGCFSCHHSLADEPWRKVRGAAGVAKGAPSWGSWYYPMTAALLESPVLSADARAKAFLSVLQPLSAETSRPIPDATAVKRMAEQGIRALDGVIQEFSTGPASSRRFDAAGVEQLIDGFNHRESWNKVASWDHAAQRYLALVPLNQAWHPESPGRAKQQEALSQQLRAVLEKLRFPEGYDSPRGFDPGRLPVGR
jgi:hypothetical protein